MIKKKLRQWETDNPEKVKAYKKKWTDKNKEKIKIKDELYRKNNPIKVRKWDKDAKIRRRLKVLNYYGGTPPKCKCCGEDEIKFLSVDHINNDGAEHRKKTNIRGGNNAHKWIIKNKFPPIFQILCYNCNCAKGFFGECPHSQRRGSRKVAFKSKDYLPVEA